MNWSRDIIDLTDSFTLADHCALSNAVIELDTDDSFIDDCTRNVQTTIDQGHEILVTKSIVKPAHKRRTSILKDKNQASVTAGRQSDHKASKKQTCKFGDCPVCWDELGHNPLASTKCGHVFCLKCLERCLVVEKKCPTCRKILKGSSAYHPLYLSRS